MTSETTTLPSGVRTKTARGVKTSRLVYLVHSWLGLKFFLVLTLVMLTGTLAVLREEIDWLIYPQIRVTPGPEQVGFDRILSAVRDAQPDAGILGEVSLRGNGRYSALNVVTVSITDGVRRVWVDPYRGVVQGSTPLMTPGYFLSQLHAYLLIPTWGYVIVCSFAFFLLASIVTGLLTYRKFWRGFFRRPRLRDLRTLLGDLHRLAGLWSLWFLVIMVITSFWYFWTLVGEPMLGFPHAETHLEPPQRTAAELDRMGPARPTQLSLDALAARVAKEFPDFDIRMAALPATHEAPVTFQGNHGEPFAPYVSAVHVDPVSGNIIGRELARDGFSFRYLDSIVDKFHYGDFAGIVSKLIWFVFGLIMTGLSATGLVIFWRRTRHKDEAPASTTRKTWRVFRPWGGGMGLFKPVNLIVLAVCAYAANMAIRFYGGGAAAFPAHFAAQAIGPWRLAATAIGNVGETSNPIAPGRRIYILAGYCPDCWADIKRLWISVGDRPAAPDKQHRIMGQPGYAAARIVLPPQIDASTRLWMFAEGWDGVRHETSWPLVAKP